MGFATHLGPWMLGTVKETTGTSAALGQIRNTGTTSVTQSATIASTAMTTSPTAQALFCLPAGAKILRFNYEVITAISGGGVTNVGVTIGDSTTANKYVTTLNTGVASVKVPQATIDAAMVVAQTNNIGTTDVLFYGTFTAATGNPTAGSIVVTVEYVVRAPDGSAYPASA